MTFFLSKAVWLFAQPGNLLTLLVVMAAGLLMAGWIRTGRAIVVGVAVLMAALALTPLAERIAAPLEDRFPRPPPPERVDGIILLGGAVNPYLTASRHEPSVNEAAERLLAFVELGRRYPEARMVASGGSGSVFYQDEKEDGVVRGVLEQVGFDTARVVYEGSSRNTWENARFSQSLMAPRPGETWILVTSALHMPRSVGIFRRIGWPVVPWPVDYQTYPPDDAPLSIGFANRLELLSLAVREWIGLVAYRLLDRTGSLLPGP